MVGVLVVNGRHRYGRVMVLICVQCWLGLVVVMGSVGIVVLMVVVME